MLDALLKFAISYLFVCGEIKKRYECFVKSIETNIRLWLGCVYVTSVFTLFYVSNSHILRVMAKAYYPLTHARNYFFPNIWEFILLKKFIASNILNWVWVFLNFSSWITSRISSLNMPHFFARLRRNTMLLQARQNKMKQNMDKKKTKTINGAHGNTGHKTEWILVSRCSLSHYITITCLDNFDSLKPQFYIVKSGFTGVYIIFSYFCSKT